MNYCSEHEQTGKCTEESCEMCKLIGVQDALLNPQPGKIIKVAERPEMITPFHIIVCPDSDLHRALALKLMKLQLRPGEIVLLSTDEMALLSEFIVWPNPRPTASF